MFLDNVNLTETIVNLVFLFVFDYIQELNGMIVQEKIVESKHQKKQIAEVCTFVECHFPF